MEGGKKNGVRVMHILRSYSLMCVNANMFKEDNCNKICSTCKPFSILKKQNSKYVDDIIGISEFVLEAHLKMDILKMQNLSLYITCVLMKF